MIDYLIEMTCIYVRVLLCFHPVKFYVPVYYHVSLCKPAQALVQSRRYALKQMFNYFYYFFINITI